MDKSLLKEILSVPTYSTHEDLMRDYILKWAYIIKFETDIDERHLLVAHLDRHVPYPFFENRQLW